MFEKHLEALSKSRYTGYVLLEVVYDETGFPSDFIFKEVNEAYALFSGKQINELVNHSIREVFPQIDSINFDWLGVLGELAMHGGQKVFNYQSELFNKRSHIHLFSDNRKYVSMIIIETGKEIQNFSDQSEDQKIYKLFSEYSSDVIWILNYSTGKFLYISPSVHSLRGLTVEEAMAESFEKAIDEESLNKVIDDIKRITHDIFVLKKEPPIYIIEVQQPCKDGSLVWVELSCNIRLNENSEVEVFGISRNIQRRKTVELALKASEAQYRKLIENSQDIIFKLHTDGDIIFISPSCKKQLGYSSHEMIGHSLLQYIYSDDQPVFINLINQLNQIKELSENIEIRLINKNNNIEWFSIIVSAVRNDDNKAVAIDGIARNINEKHLSEEKLRKLSQVVEQSPNMIMITSLDGVIEYVNQSCIDISGFSREELIGSNYHVMTTEDLDEYDYKSLWEAIAEGRAWRGEMLVKRKNGDLYWQGLSISPILNNQGKASHYIAISQDITERKRIEDELYDLNITLEKSVEERTSELSITNEFLMQEILKRKQKEQEIQHAREEAEKANKTKTEFISRMSHELRTPLNSILGFAQLLEMGELNPGQRKGVRHILTSGKHLLKLINEVLDISKIEAGKFTLTSEIVKLKTVIDEAIDLVMPLTVEKQIEIRNLTQDINGLAIETDKQRLVQVLVNLLNNAIKYNKVEGKVDLLVELPDDQISENKFLNIIVSDTGVGMSQQSLSKLFIPFERIEQNESVIEGTGLGLSIAKEIITAMGGEIIAESILGEGSKFTIQLPWSKTMGNQVVVQIADELDDMIKIIQKGTILHIENDHSNIELMEDIIVGYRPEIRIISDTQGGRAVDLAIEHTPDLIFLDYDLPDMSGVQVLEELKRNKNTKLLPVIILSGDLSADQIRSLLKAGADDVLFKPLNAADVLNMIDNYRKTN